MKILHKFRWTILAIVFVIIFDQASKLWADANLATACNTAWAFGLGGSNFASGLVSGALLAVLILLLFREKRGGLVFGYALVTGGGLSNLVDRVTRGCVLDFIKVVDWYPSFNLADSAVTLGAGILILSLVKRENLGPD